LPAIAADAALLQLSLIRMLGASSKYEESSQIETSFIFSKRDKFSMA